MTAKTRGTAKARLVSRIVFIVLLVMQAILWYGAGIHAVGKLSPRVFFGTMRGMLTAATFFWGAIFLLALVVGPVYCGWVCAFGSYQDVVCGLLAGRRGAARYAEYVRYIKYIKYVLLVFLLGRSIVEAVKQPAPKFVLRLGMPAPFDGMANPGTLAWLAGTALLVYVLDSRAWCRYLCPFGAAISVLSIAAPYRVRVVGECRDCGLCDKACPAGISVSGYAREGRAIDARECLSCLECVNACPSSVLAWKPRDGAPRKAAEQVE